MKYKEGFSTALARQLIESGKGAEVLDPFSGAGTTVLTAMGLGVQGTGIEILPLGNLAAQAVVHAANGLSAHDFRDASQALLRAVSHEEPDFGTRSNTSPSPGGPFRRPPKARLPTPGSSWPRRRTRALRRS